jgi:2-keto-4-pentenoate hydratase/2-oxohepta-3-ene-1,7-dioic acid hydratase in catechol pathway
MKILRYIIDGAIQHGIIEGDHVRRLTGSPYFSLELSDIKDDLRKIQIIAPVSPSKIVAVGVNYRDHAGELEMEPPSDPVIFLKPPTALLNPGGTIVLPPESNRVDYEGELAVIIGKTCRNVSQSEALSFVLGYTCFNDVTARDLQEKDKQWTRSKSFDTFAPVGPFVVTDLDPGALLVETRVNGRAVQQGSTADMIHPVPEVVAFISRVMTLNPGDVIATGTPSGVGPLKHGNVVEVEIRGIGVLKNAVV